MQTPLGKRVAVNGLKGVPNLAPAFFAVGPLVLTIAALIACYLPARRASLVDPMAALRSL